MLNHLLRDIDLRIEFVWTLVDVVPVDLVGSAVPTKFSFFFNHRHPPTVQSQPPRSRQARRTGTKNNRMSLAFIRKVRGRKQAHNRFSSFTLVSVHNASKPSRSLIFFPSLASRGE